MSVQKIPNSEKQIIQSNDGDYKGNLWASFGIDLDSNPGTIKTSKRLKRVLDSALWGTDDIVQAFQVHDGYYYVATTEDIFRCSVSQNPTDADNWSAIDHVGSPDHGLESDLTSYNNFLLNSLGTDIAAWNGTTLDVDWWTTVANGTALTASKPHTMDVLKSGTDTLFITNGSQVRYYNGASGGSIVSLGDSSLTANCLTPTLDRMWVGSYTEVGDNASVFEISPGVTADAAAVYTQSYLVDGRACLTMFTHKNTPFVITEKGYIQTFNGAGFVTVAQFPWANDSKVMEGCRPGLIQDSPTSLAIHPKGARVKGKYAYIYVNTDDEYVSGGTNLSTRGPSGVWVLDLDTYSLTHRYALTAASTDFGVSKVDRSGPVLITNTPETRIMVGGSIDGVEGVWMEGTETPQGYFITTRHESDSVADAFESFITKADILDTNEQILVKYQDKTRPNFPLQVNDVTWFSANQFNTTNALTGVEVGDEVEVVAGYAAGNLCHIVSISGDTTKAVVVDGDFGVLNQQSDIYITNFKKLEEPHTDESGDRVKRGSADENSTFRQHKIVMRGNVTVREVISKSNSKEEL